MADIGYFTSTVTGHTSASMAGGMVDSEITDHSARSAMGPGGSQICEHGRHKRQCKDCGGGSICEHSGRRWSWGRFARIYCRIAKLSKLASQPLVLSASDAVFYDAACAYEAAVADRTDITLMQQRFHHRISCLCVYCMFVCLMYGRLNRLNGDVTEIPEP